MKVCLVRPAMPPTDGAPSLNKPAEQYIGNNPHPPFGLVTLAAYMENHDLTVCDFQLPNAELPTEADVYLFSIFSIQLAITEKLIWAIKKQNPYAKCIVGGPGVTYNTECAAELMPSANMLYAGEGEHFALHFDHYFCSPIKTVKSPTLYNWKPHKTARWDLIDYQHYVKTRGLAIETSRGCPFNCVFCTGSLINGKQWRPRKPADVVQELKYVSETYGTKRFHVTDDNATVDPERWKTLMQQIAEADLGLDIEVLEGIQAHHLDYETLKLMKAAGLTKFTIGAESGSQRVLDEVINKGGLTVERTEQVIRDAVSLKMKPSCFFVIGIAGETLAEAEQTVNFAQKMRKLGAVNCAVRNAIPMPGTRLQQIAIENDYLTVPAEELDRFNYVHSGKHLMQTPEWTPTQIEQLVAKASMQNLRHIARFSNLIRHPRSTLKLRWKIRRLERNAQLHVNSAEESK